MTSDDTAPSEGSCQGELVQTLEKLARLEGGMTPQERGRIFNELLADSLRLGGLSPGPNRVGQLGEVDVPFIVGEIPFVVEATWVAQPIDFDPLAKLAARVRQRFEGTLGIFISMSGYTAPALANLERSGERPRVLLFDGRHVEAIVAGRIPPADLIRAALKVASFTGRIHVSPDDLLAVIEHGEPIFPTSLGEYPALGPPMRRRAPRRRFRRGPKALARTDLAVLALAVAIAAVLLVVPGGDDPGPSGTAPGSPECQQYRVTATGNVVDEFGTGTGAVVNRGDPFIPEAPPTGHQLSNRYYGTVPAQGISGYVLKEKLECP